MNSKLTYFDNIFQMVNLHVTNIEKMLKESQLRVWWDTSYLRVTQTDIMTEYSATALQAFVGVLILMVTNDPTPVSEGNQTVI